jgi:hypothetical protein
MKRLKSTFRLIYKKWDKCISIKFLLNEIAVDLVDRIETVKLG